MIVKLLTEHHLEFLSLTGGCGGLAESTLVKMSNCWKSHAAAQYMVITSISILKQRKIDQVYASLDYSQSGLASCMFARTVSVGLF